MVVAPWLSLWRLFPYPNDPERALDSPYAYPWRARILPFASLRRLRLLRRRDVKIYTALILIDAGREHNVTNNIGNNMARH